MPLCFNCANFVWPEAVILVLVSMWQSLGNQSIASSQVKITYHQTTTPTITAILAPILAPITIHFQLSSLLASTAPSVVDIVGVNKAFKSEMFAPIALSSSDLYILIMSSNVLAGRTEILPMKSARGCCT